MQHQFSFLVLSQFASLDLIFWEISLESRAYQNVPNINWISIGDYFQEVYKWFFSYVESDIQKKKKNKTDEQNYLPKNHSKSVNKLISHNLCL